MDFTKICAVAVICCAAVLLLSKREKELSAIVSAVVYIIIISFAVSRVGEVFEQVGESVRNAVEIKHSETVLKCAGISLLASVASTVCENAGDKGMAKAVETLAVIEIVYVGLPIFNELFSTAKMIFGA